MGLLFPIAASAACSPVALGGTGSCSITAADVLFGNGTSPIATSSTFVFSTALSRLTVTNASTTNSTVGTSLWLTALAGNAAGTLIAVDPAGKVVATSTSSGVTAVTGTYPIISSGGSTPAISIAFGTTTANTWSALQVFNGGASTTLFSVLSKAYFGSTATSTFDSAGNLSVAGTLNVTGQTTLARASSTIFSALGPAYFGSTASSSFSTTGALTLATPLLIGSGGTGLSTIGASSTILTTNGTSAFWQQINLGAAVYGVLPVSNGGTGAATLTGCLTGNGTGAITGSGTCNTSAATVTSVATTYPVTGGTFTTSGTIALAFGTTTANTWSALQIFNGNASTSLFSTLTKAYFGSTATTTIDSVGNVAVAGTLNVTGTATMGNASTTNLSVTAGEITGFYNLPIYMASSTWGSGTTTIKLLLPNRSTTVKTSRCQTSVGTLNVQLGTGSASTSMFQASTTNNNITFASNNNITGGSFFLLDIGTAASSPTNVNCTFEYVQ